MLSFLAESQSPSRLSFGSDSYYLTLGENRLIPFTARNTEAAPDNMTIRLHGYDTASFDYSCGSGCYISSGNRKLSIRDINPDEGRTYFFRLIPSSPGTEHLEFNVTIDSDPDFYEIYTIDITTGYPVFFPGLGMWGIAFMLLAAGLVFMSYGKMPGKKG
jgi:hypothetical protein